MSCPLKNPFRAGTSSFNYINNLPINHSKNRCAG